MSAINLTELFNAKVFRIPDYQRGYAWEEKQLSELWDDLDEIQKISGDELRKHYTGTIYLEETNPSGTEQWLSGYKFYNVVDGQQRLTTISILLFELLKATDTGYIERKKEKLIDTYVYESNSTGESKVYKFCYAQTDKNYSFLLQSIFEEKNVVSTQENNRYTENLRFAKEYFKKKIAELDEGGRNELFKKLVTSLQFDVRTIEKDLDVQAVFETMNNRGKPHSTLEKLKNRLVYLTDKLTNPEEDKRSLRQKINDAWGRIYTCLAQNPNQILDEDVFLSAHLSLYRRPEEPTFSEKTAEEKVFQMFCNKPEKYNKDGSETKEEPVTSQKIEDYIIKLSELAPVWYEIHNTKDKLIKKILILSSSKEIKIFLAALLYKANNRSLIDHILVNLEKILFRNRIPGIGVMDERTLASWAREIYNNENDIQDICQKQIGLLNIPVNVPNIVQGFNYLFTYERGAKGFHRWDHLKYLLFGYEDSLREKAQEKNDKVTIDDFSGTTIEHIIPQQWRDHWADTVQSVTALVEPEKQYQTEKVLINTLGNLTILSNGKNPSLGNKRWIDKKERFSTGSYNEIAISKKERWTKDEIAERGKEILKFLEKKIGGFTFSDQDIEKTLFCEDYIIDIIYDKNQVK
jgi:uncharacterized protein with ParB-like and HNH nuclease domain